jgi:5-formyltetrahydrofolate cyclo-ligase
MNYSEEKSKIREALKIKRGELEVAVATNLSRDVIERIIPSFGWKHLKTIHIYQSLLSLREVDTRPLVKYLDKTHRHIKVYAPADRIGDSHLLMPDNMEVSLPADLDLIIVPLVAFDESCNRIGMGGGYYDRFLKNYPKARKVGLAYELQKVSHVPVEQHDVRLDQIVTEKSVYKC